MAFVVATWWVPECAFWKLFHASYYTDIVACTIRGNIFDIKIKAITTTTGIPTTKRVCNNCGWNMWPIAFRYTQSRNNQTRYQGPIWHPPLFKGNLISGGFKTPQFVIQSFYHWSNFLRFFFSIFHSDYNAVFIIFPSFKN